MRRVSLLLIHIFLIYLSCSSTYQLQRGDFTLQELNDKIDDKSAIIKLTNRQEFEVEYLSLTSTKSSFSTKKGNRFEIPTKKIIEIDIKDHGRGAIEGLGIGVLGGFTFGALIGYIS